MKTLEELKDEYIAAIARAQAIRDIVNPMRESLEEAIQHITHNFETANAEILAENEELSKAATEAEKALRAAILAQYQANVAEGKTAKTLGEGLSVQVRKKFTVTNEGEAVKWAKEYAPILIKESIDVKGLEKIAESAELNFVEYAESVSAVIKL